MIIWILQYQSGWTENFEVVGIYSNKQNAINQIRQPKADERVTISTSMYDDVQQTEYEFNFDVIENGVTIEVLLCRWFVFPMELDKQINPERF